MALGWKILMHSFALIFRNLPTAFRISIPMLVAIIIVSILQLFIVSPMPFDLDGEIPDDSGARFILPFFLAAILGVFAIYWTAVAWHRFVLLNENPSGLIPKVKMQLIWAYVARSLIIFIVLIPAMLVAMLIGFLITAVSDSFVVITIWFPIVLNVGAGWLAMRFGLTLPHVAIGESTSLGWSWAETAPANWAILFISAIIFVANIAFYYAISSVAPISLVLVFIASVITSWVTAMVGISVLTTLYGHLVENRELA